MTPDLRYFHDLYERCDAAQHYQPAAQRIGNLIDKTATAVMGNFRLEGFTADNADAAEDMVAAITRYFFQSNPDFLEAVPPARASSE
jgi:hypothetical protein